MNTREQQTTDITQMTPEEIKAYLKAQEKEAEVQKAKEIDKYNKDKTNFIKTVIKTYKTINNELSELKEFTISTGTELNNRMYTVRGKEPKETKSFTISNPEDTFKITIERAEYFKFTEEANVHINAIREIFENKFAARNKGLYEILNGLLMRNRNQEYDAKLLAKVRIQINKLGDEKLIEEFSSLEKCQVVAKTSTYCRAYEKDNKGSWKQINIQFSTL